MTNTNNLTNELLNNAPVSAPAPASTAKPAGLKPATFTFPATINKVDFNKDTGKPYVSILPKVDIDIHFADIHPALAFRAAGQEYSPIFAMLHDDITVQVVLKVVDGKKQCKMISPYPSDEQIAAYNAYCEILKNVKHEATEEEVKRSEF